MSENQPPGGRSDRPSILDQAMRAADNLIGEVQHRLPPELVSQLRSGQRQIDQRLSRLQEQLGRSATRAEVNRLSDRVEELAAQVEELLRRTSPEGCTARPDRRSTGAPGAGARTRTSRERGTTGTTRAPRSSSRPAPRRSSPDVVPGEERPSTRRASRTEGSGTREGTRQPRRNSRTTGGDRPARPRRTPRRPPEEPPAP